MPKITTIADCEAAIRRIEQLLSFQNTNNIDRHGMRSINNGRSVAGADYVTQDELVAATEDLTVTRVVNTITNAVSVAAAGQVKFIRITLTADIAIANGAYVLVPDSLYLVEIKQDATGGWDVTSWPSDWKGFTNMTVRTGINDTTTYLMSAESVTVAYMVAPPIKLDT